MIRRTSGAFRGLGTNVSTKVNFLDLAYNGPVVRSYSQYTAGTTILDRLSPVFPPTVEKCDLLSFSVNAKLNLFVSEISQQAVDSPYGRFGKIIAGLTQVGAPTSGIYLGNNVPWTQKLQQLPDDLTLVNELWNPANDPLPPQIVGFSGPDYAQGLQLSLTHTLPNPIPLFQGTEILIGIWVLPSLQRCAQLAGDIPLTYIFGWSATYSLIYDDNAP